MQPEFENNLPIYIQLVEAIKKSVISGALQAGQRLPSVREWALQVKVNPNTMQKALAELEELGLVYTERTNGKFVTNDQTLILRYRQEYANRLSQHYLENMQQLGYTKTEAVCYLEAYGGEQ